MESDREINLWGPPQKICGPQTCRADKDAHFSWWIKHIPHILPPQTFTVCVCAHAFSPAPACLQTPGYLNTGGCENKGDMENRKEAEEEEGEADGGKIIHIRSDAAGEPGGMKNVCEQQGMWRWWKQNRKNRERRFGSQICFWKNVLVVRYV